MSSVLETEGMSKILHRCKPAQIPLCKIDCSYKNSRFNHFVEQWLQAHESLQSDYEALRTKSAFPKKLSPKVKPLREYRPQMSSADAGAPSYLTTEMYKRISPEFLDLLQSQGRIHKIEDSRVYPGKAYSEAMGSSMVNIDPNLAKYLTDVMQSGGISNYVYGLDYVNKKGPLDSNTNAFDLIPILEILKVGNAITPAQLQYLINFLNDATQPDDSERLSTLLAMLHDHGVLTPAIADVLKNLLLQMGRTFRPSTLDKLYNIFDKLSKLNQSDDNSRLQSIIALLKADDKHGPRSARRSDKDEPRLAGSVGPGLYGPDAAGSDDPGGPYGRGSKNRHTGSDGRGNLKGSRGTRLPTGSGGSGGLYGHGGGNDRDRSYGRGDKFGPDGFHNRVGSYRHGGPYGPGLYGPGDMNFRAGSFRPRGPNTGAGSNGRRNQHGSGGANTRAGAYGRGGTYGPGAENRRGKSDASEGVNKSEGANTRAGTYGRDGPYGPGAENRPGSSDVTRGLNKSEGRNTQAGKYGRGGSYGPGAANRPGSSDVTGDVNKSGGAITRADTYGRGGPNRPGTSDVTKDVNKSGAANTQAGTYGRGGPNRPGAANRPVGWNGAGSIKKLGGANTPVSNGTGGFREHNIIPHQHDHSGPENRGGQSDGRGGAKSRPASLDESKRIIKRPSSISRAGSRGRAGLPEHKSTHAKPGLVHFGATSETRKIVERGSESPNVERQPNTRNDTNTIKVKPTDGVDAKGRGSSVGGVYAKGRGSSVGDVYAKGRASSVGSVYSKGRTSSIRGVDAKGRASSVGGVGADLEGNSSRDVNKFRIVNSQRQSTHVPEVPSKRLRGKVISEIALVNRPVGSVYDEQQSALARERAWARAKARANARKEAYIRAANANRRYTQNDNDNLISPQDFIRTKGKSVTLNTNSKYHPLGFKNSSKRPSMNVDRKKGQKLYKIPSTMSQINTSRRRSSAIPKVQIHFEKNNQIPIDMPPSTPTFNRAATGIPEIGFFKPIDHGVPWQSLHDFKVLAKAARVSRRDRAKLRVKLTRGLSYYTALNKEHGTPRPSNPVVVTDLRTLPSFLLPSEQSQSQI